MKKIVFFAICVVGLLGFTSCGSTAPCGLSQQTKEIEEVHEPVILVADATIE